MPQELEEIRTLLEQIAEDLADHALAALRASVEAGESRSAQERRLTRARRAVEKAAGLLSPEEVSEG